MSDTAAFEEILKHFRVTPKCYSIGPFFRDGVTIYKQQVRTLNLIDALAKARVIYDVAAAAGGAADSGRKLAIVGGGVSGMTAAVAALRLGNQVWHFEQRPSLCHIQAGCSTRWVHPRIYEWPAAGATNPYAGLPILSWQEGTAAQVARALVDEYDTATENKPGFRLHLGATTFVDADDGTIQWDNSTGERRGGTERFDAIILAVGFGTEAGVREGRNASYWRNDSLNQVHPGVASERVDHIVISGTGDGGLVDLLRAKLQGFDQGRIVHDLFGEVEPIAEDGSMHSFLVALKNLRTTAAGDTGSVFFATLERWWSEPAFSPTLDVIAARLKKSIRSDVSVTLNGRARTLPDALRIGGASLLNLFLVYLLYRQRAFTYVPGELGEQQDRAVAIHFPDAKSTSENPPKGTKTTFSFDRLIVRHGAAAESTLRHIGLSEEAIGKLKARQEETSASDTSKPLWRRERWDGNPIIRAQTAFLPAPSQAIAAMLASMTTSLVRDALRADGMTSPQFRVTVHRAFENGSQRAFQQMCPYFGTDPDEGAAARVFDAAVGTVGFVFRTGAPISVSADHFSSQGWEDLWQRSFSTKSGLDLRASAASKRSVLAMPIFGFPARVSLVVYADSPQKEVFGSTRSVRAAYNAAIGFVESCRRLLKDRVIRFAKGEFDGYPKDALPSADLNAERQRTIQSIDDYCEAAITACDGLHWDCVCMGA